MWRRTAATRSSACRRDPIDSSSPGGTAARVEQWYQNADSPYQGHRPVTVTNGQDLAGLNVTLVKGATISGKVTAPAGVSPSSINVTGLSGSLPRTEPASYYQFVGAGRQLQDHRPSGGILQVWLSEQAPAEPLDQWYKNASSFGHSHIGDRDCGPGPGRHQCHPGQRRDHQRKNHSPTPASNSVRHHTKRRYRGGDGGAGLRGGLLNGP